jgi:murein DD-endopeptidase MepM/ murein hydrolase activator NlpD
VFASTAGGVRLRLVSAEPVVVAFHEASYDDALALHPTGACGRCRNPTKFTPPTPRDPALRYLVTHSRGRDTPATSAADLVLPRGTPVLSPVDGTVVRVRRYRLYRAYPDVRLEIRPHGAPGRLVVLLHLGAVPVRRGDPVVASTTVLGTPRRLPFESQVDRYVRGRYPHVHLEVKDAAAARQAAL